MLDRRDSMEMRTPAILSAGLHVVALVAAVVNFNLFSHPPIEPEPVMVEFEAIAKHAAAPKVGIQEPQPEKAKISDETTKAPPPKTGEPKPTPEAPKKEVAEAIPVPPKPEEKKVQAEKPKPAEDKIALKPKEPEPPKVEKPDPKPEPKPEVKKPEPKPPVTPPKPPPKHETVDNIVDSILKNNDKNPPIKTPQQAPQKPKEITRQAPMAPNLAAVVTASEIEGVRQKIRPCWNFIGGAKADVDLVVQLVVQMNQDGTPVDAEIKDTGRYNRDPYFRAAADAARRAVLNPRCQPWPLPADKYANGWRYIVFNFDPRDY